MLTFSAKLFAIATFLAVVGFVGLVLWKTLFPSLHPEEHAASANKQYAQEESAKQDTEVGVSKTATDEKIATYTLALAVFTALLVLVSAFQIGFLIRADNTASETAQAAKDSADAAYKAAVIAEKTLVAAQRAWIRLDEIGIGGGGLAFDQNGASVSISFKITNVGNSPAINITHHAWLIVLKNGGPYHWQEQQRLCGEIRHHSFAAGFTLFPNETFPQNMGFGGWSIGTNVSQDEIKKALPASASGKNVILYVYGCVDYTFPTDPTIHHQTGFIRELRRNGPAFLSPDDGLIPISQLVLMDTGTGMGQYAD
jgi:hypothetical protein